MYEAAKRVMELLQELPADEGADLAAAVLERLADRAGELDDAERERLLATIEHAQAEIAAAGDRPGER
jgi:hypothetical protein